MMNTGCNLKDRVEALMELGRLAAMFSRKLTECAEYIGKFVNYYGATIPTVDQRKLVDNQWASIGEDLYNCVKNQMGKLQGSESWSNMSFTVHTVWPATPSIGFRFGFICTGMPRKYHFNAPIGSYQIIHNFWLAFNVMFNFWRLRHKRKNFWKHWLQWWWLCIMLPHFFDYVCAEIAQMQDRIDPRYRYHRKE